MFAKIVTLLAVIALTNAGYLQPSFRYASPAFHAAPAIGFAAPHISRVEHLAPAVATSYKTDVFTPPIARTYEIAPATTHFAAAPAVHHVARAPFVHAVPAIPFAGHGYQGAHLLRAAPTHFGLAGHYGYGHAKYF